jgi:DNA-binding transcriptional LysR family regulator
MGPATHVVQCNAERLSLHAMHDLDLNLLTALDALLQDGSVVRAAARVGLTPPAMSRALGRLRVALDDPLLVRAGRRLVPTPRAAALRDRVHAAFAEARALLGPEAPPEPAQLHRRFTVRADDAVLAVIGPALLARLSAVAPGVTVVFAAEGDEDVAALREGHIDLDIGVQGDLAPEIRVRKLFDDHRVVLVRKRGSPRRPLSLAAFARRPQVDISRRGRMRGPIDDALAAHGLVRRVVAVVSTHLAAAVLVAQSDAVSLVSSRFARSISRCLDVTWLPPPAALTTAAIAMAWHPRFDADASHAWFRDEVAALAGTDRTDGA